MSEKKWTGIWRAVRWYFSLVQLLSRVRLFATPWIAARQASLSITNSRSSPKLMSIELVMPSSHLILCRPLLLLPWIPSSIRVFSNESTLRMRWLLTVQGTLKSLLEHHSSKASILHCSSSSQSNSHIQYIKIHIMGVPEREDIEKRAAKNV